MGSGQKHNPLSVPTQDKKGFTPFVIAVYRRHLDLARTVLDIADAQHELKKDNLNRQYTIADSEGEDISDDASDDRNYLHASSMRPIPSTVLRL